VSTLSAASFLADFASGSKPAAAQTTAAQPQPPPPLRPLPTLPPAPSLELKSDMKRELPPAPTLPLPQHMAAPPAVPNTSFADYERGFTAGAAEAEKRLALEYEAMLAAQTARIEAEMKAGREAEIARLHESVAEGIDRLRTEADAALAAALAPFAAAMTREAAFDQLRRMILDELSGNAMEVVIRGPVGESVALQAIFLRNSIAARLEHGGGREIEVLANGELFRTRIGRVVEAFVTRTMEPGTGDAN